MIDFAADVSFPTSHAFVARHAAAVARKNGLPRDWQEDFQQEASVDLWRNSPALWDGCEVHPALLRQIVANCLKSLMRRERALRRGWRLQAQFDAAAYGVQACDDRVESRIDVDRVLARLSPFDQAVAGVLFNYSPTEACGTMGIARATLYRSIVRLRKAFTQAGLHPQRLQPKSQSDARAS